jgi:hypothetical protein
MTSCRDVPLERLVVWRKRAIRQIMRSVGTSRGLAQTRTYEIKNGLTKMFFASVRKWLFSHRERRSTGTSIHSQTAESV